MATVYVVTAGSGDSYRIERVHLDPDEPYGFAKDHNLIAPAEPVQVEEWHTGAPPAAYDGSYWRRGVIGASPRQQASRSACGTPATTNGATTSTSVKNAGPAAHSQRPR